MVYGAGWSRAERSLFKLRTSIEAAKENINKPAVTRANGISLRLSRRNCRSADKLQHSIGCLADS